MGDQALIAAKTAKEPCARPFTLRHRDQHHSCSQPCRRNQCPCGHQYRGAASSNAVVSKPKFTKQQIAGRLRQLKLLFEEGMLTDEFYSKKVAECEAAE